MVSSFVKKAHLGAFALQKSLGRAFYVSLSTVFNVNCYTTNNLLKIRSPNQNAISIPMHKNGPKAM